MSKYPTKRLRRNNLIASLLLIFVLPFLSLDYTFLGLGVSVLIIPQFCAKHNLSRNRKSIIKVAAISFICALPWLLMVVIPIEYRSYITNRGLSYAILFFLVWLKDFTITILSLPRNPCEEVKCHIPYWLLIGMFVFIFDIATPMQNNLNLRRSLTKGIELTFSIQNSMREFYLKEGRFPKSSKEMGLSDKLNNKPETIKSINVQPEGIIIIAYNIIIFSRFNENVELYLKIKIKNNKAVWECIDEKGIRYLHKYLPLDCRSSIENYRQQKISGSINENIAPI